jgi:amino acid adenylation domain-containing protein
MAANPATLVEALQQSSQRLPQASACEFREQRLDYASLQQRVYNLAAALRANGAGPGVRVGIYMATSMEAFIAVHAVLCAGAAYVPLDPKLPLERLRFMLEDCQVEHLVTQRERLPMVRRLPPQLAGQLRLFGPPGSEYAGSLSWARINQDDARPDWPGPAADDTAYIMYTSGSTGNPKGIVHTHASGLAYARASVEAFEVTQDDRIAGFAPLHFDQSTFHLFSAPLAAAAVVLVPDEYGSFPVDLAGLIDEQAMTIWYSVPYALVQLATRGELQRYSFSALRWVKFGGEAFPAKYLGPLMQHFSKASFANIYGPAEVNQCLHYVLPEAPEEQDSIPIGQAWEAAQLAVVNEQLETLPCGEEGELLVATSTMMRGYWGRDDLNHQAFVYPVNGCFAVAGEAGPVDQPRYYRTGDLVCRQANGQYDFRGRRDRQVKARGYRIELDEVESALLQHPDVIEAAAFTVPMSEGSLQLEAALILRSVDPLSSVRIRQFLLNRLPAYAIPQQVFFYDQFPRTGSGKIDRLKLAAKATAARSTQANET